MKIDQQIRVLKFEFETNSIENLSSVESLTNGEFKKIKQLIKVNEIDNEIKISPNVKLIFLNGKVTIEDV